MTLRLLVVLSAVTRAALPTSMTTVIAPGANPTFHRTMPHLNAAVSSRMKFRWVLTRGTLARALVSTADIAIDDAKETACMALYEHDRDTLEAHRTSSDPAYL
jgi:hypothetical protein